MTRLYAVLAAACLALMIGGTALWTAFRDPDPCGVGAVAGATIGGPFELLKGAGELVTEAEVIDRPALVYFGYTFCPDVCPFDVARNVLAVDLLADQGVELRPVFVSIDPARDTPEVMAQYAEDMHPEMWALTGSAEQVQEAAQAYRVYYAKGPGEDEFYLMDHSTFTYLMLPVTGLAAFFRREDTAEGIAEAAACLIDRM